MKKENKKLVSFIVIVVVCAITMLLLAYYQFDVQSKRDSSKIFIIMSIVITLFSIASSIFLYFKKTVTTEKVFIWIVPILCLLFMICMPIYKAHDEFRHWYRAFEVSEGKLISEVEDGKVTSDLPKNVITGNVKTWNNIKYKEILQNINEPIDKNREKVDTSMVAVYSPVQYIPQAIGFNIAKMFTDKILIIAYAGRIANAIVALLLVYFAIKIIPFGKNLILMIAMLPLSLEAFSSLSPDAITISIILVFIAYVFKIVYTENYLIKKRDKVVLMLIGFIIAMCKIVYVPLIFLVLLIPFNKYKSKKDKVFYTMLIILVTCISSVIWFAIANNFLATSSDGVSTQQMLSIFSNPIQYIQKLIYTINYNGVAYFTNLFGAELEHAEIVKLYSIVPFVFGILFLLEAITNKKMKDKMKNYQLVVMAIIVLMIIGLIFTSLYMQWTKVGSNTIDGVQGRYFIPILLLLGMMLSRFKIISLYSEQKMAKLIGISSNILYIYIILAIITIHV